MLTCWIADFRKSQKGKYLIMCLALAADAHDYAYAPIVGHSNSFSGVSELFARAGEKFLATFHRMPDVVFAAIAKTSDSDDEMKGVFLYPLSIMLRAAVQGEPFPGIKHYGVTFLITSSRHLDSAEAAELAALSEATFVSNAGSGDGNTGTKPEANES